MSEHLNAAIGGLIDGTPGNDTLQGAQGDDILNGGDGDDLIVVSLGADAVDGGAGVDTLAFGNLQALPGSTFNTLEASGGSMVALDPSTGMRGVVNFIRVENFIGSPYDDVLFGNGRPNEIYGGAGNDTIADSLDGGGRNYLRGEEGNDSIVGGEDFDDINGNQGADTISGDLGDDWTVGGKDNDLLFGDQVDDVTVPGAPDGNDLVYGNLGDDTCHGGGGDDIVRGGQGNDSLVGGTGADFISGDRGDDTVAGGAGADIFHGSQDAGIDRVLDFNASEGDRVVLDPGTTFTTAQVGADVVIDMGGANQMILVGVQLAELPTGWISD